jgi:3-oxoacyl-[acyl-carrier-protein] synthase-3
MVTDNTEGRPIEDRSRAYIHMKGKDLFKLAVRHMETASQHLLDRNGIHRNDIRLIVPHQANIRILESFAKRFDVPMDRVYVNIDRYGNTIGATIPIALHEARQESMIKEGDHVLLVSFGAGLTYGASLLKA